MDFAFAEEQDMLRAAAREWLTDRYPPGRVAELADSDDGWDPRSWRELTGLGWLDPDLGMLDYAVLAEEAGRALYPGPWWTTIGLGGPVLGTVPTEPTTLAWAAPGAGGLLALGPAVRAEPRGAGWTLAGRSLRVPDLATCVDVLVVADAPGAGVGIWSVRVGDAGVHPLSTVDGTRRLADLTLDEAAAELVVAPGRAAPVLAAVRRRASALLACEATGIAQRALDVAAAHAGTRTQFGRPIASYQAVSHRIADVYTRLQLGRSLAYRAAWAVGEAEADSATDAAAEADTAVTLAMASAGEGAVLACESAIQVLGGIGFTWDHPIHRWYKRALWIAAFEGTRQSRRAELATVLLGPAR